MTESSDQTKTSGWDEHALRDPHQVSDKASRVEAMFDAIAPTYERVNTLATLGRDARWRRRAIAAAAVRAGDEVLDICCGTGDMIRTLAQGATSPRRIVGLDFSAEMLQAGRYGGIDVPIELVRGDALKLPFDDASFDVTSCAFGVRNFARLDAGLAEMQRVLRVGGRAVILEFSTPRNPVLAWAYRLYCDSVLPRLGAWISRDRSGAYRYLPRSIQTFETTDGMRDRLYDAGFVDVSVRTMNLGGVALYRAVKG